MRSAASGRASIEGSGEVGDPFRELKITRPQITLTSAPGEQAQISARLWIARGADGVTISELQLDGANSRDLPSPTVNADGAVFRHDDVTNGHTSICFALGSPVWGRAGNTLIEENRIHGCGQVPSTNQEHGIYLSAADDTVIRGNWIYDNADRGIQMYPDAQRTVITGNVIYGNGEGLIFSGDEGVASSGARVSGNVIADSRIRRNVESYYSGRRADRSRQPGPLQLHPRRPRRLLRRFRRQRGGCRPRSGSPPPATSTARRSSSTLPPPISALVAGTACAAVLDPSPDNRLPGPGTAQESPDPPTTPPPPTTPVSAPAEPSTAPPPASRPAPRRVVTLKTSRHRGRRGARILLSGRVTGAAPGTQEARIYARRGRRWRPIASARVSAPGSFRARARLIAPGRVARLKARVPGAGSSRVVSIRVV